MPERHLKQSSTVLLGPIIRWASVLKVSITEIPQPTKAIISHMTLTGFVPMPNVSPLLQWKMIISCGHGEWIIPFRFAAAFFIFEDTSQFSLLFPKSLSFSLQSLYFHVQNSSLL